MRSLALFLTFAVFGLASPHLNDQWEAWKAEFQKVYTDEAEAVYRRAVWENKWRLVRRHNLEAEAGNSTFTLGLNQLADMTADEVNAKLNRLKEEDPASFDSWTSTRWDKGVEKVPESVDWRQYGLVSPVQNQGQCGSCWAFSAVGALEGQMARKTWFLEPLSLQNQIDCSYENHGCNGGWMSTAFQYVIDNDGIDSWRYYPYEEKVRDCRYWSRGRAGYCVSFAAVPRSNEMALQAAVAEVGPVSVSINTGLQSFQSYKKGVYDPPDCGTEINHAVLVVGYGTDQGQDYWIVKNSWGTRWGEHGYIRMARNKNLCAIARRPFYPIVRDCRYWSRGRAGYCVSFATVPRSNEMALQAAMAKVGPVSVGINAGLQSFQSYKKGVYDPPDCSTEINHAVLVVGYGTDQGQDYWIVKNSWGSRCGEHGYIRMARNKNLCAIARRPIYPIVGN